MCQCPKRANLISTQAKKACKEALEKCVNALNGLISFLPRATTYTTKLPIFVSMP